MKNPGSYTTYHSLSAHEMLTLVAMSKLFVAVDCEWKYGEYEQCSKTCGGGTKSRFPVIITHPAHDGAECPRHVVDGIPDSTTCNTQECPSE